MVLGAKKIMRTSRFGSFVLAASFVTGSLMGGIDTALLPDVTVAAHGSAINWVIACPDGRFIVTCGDDGTLRVWNRADLSPFKTISTPGVGRRAAIFTADGELMFDAGDDGKIFVRKVGKSAGFGGTKVLTSGGLALNALALSPDGAFLAAAVSNRLRVWKTKDYMVRDFPVAPGQISAMAFSSNSDEIACATLKGSTVVYDVLTKQIIKTYDSEDGVPNTSVCITPESDYIVIGDQSGRVVFRSMTDGAVIRELAAHTRAVTSSAASADGKYVATGSSDGEVKIWRTGTFPLLVTIKAQSCTHVEISPDGLLVQVSGDEGSLQQWSLERLLGRRKSSSVAETVFTQTEAE